MTTTNHTSPIGEDAANGAKESGIEKAFSSSAMSRRDDLELPGATTYLDRFVDALGLLCRSKPSKTVCKEWLSGESEELQSWAVSNARIYWQMGIGTIEAAQHLADNPEEGEGHEGFTSDYARTDLAANGGDGVHGMKVVSWETWGNVIEALERAFLALGSAGGNTANGPYRAEWERARAAIHEAENARTALTAEKVADPVKCPHCGLTDVELLRSCHNSACIAYAREESFYRGWDAVPQPAQPAQAATLSDAATSAVRDVLAERVRQVEVEGWTPEHDDEHTDGSLAVAGACYALVDARDTIGGAWPWDFRWWKPTTQRRNLIKAAALILAEIERIDRAAKEMK